MPPDHGAAAVPAYRAAEERPPQFPSLLFDDAHGERPLVGPRNVPQPLTRSPGIDLVVQRNDAEILADADFRRLLQQRSEEHTSELQSLMRISYAVFCLKK